MKNKIAKFAASKRILISRLVFLIALFFLLFTTHSWENIWITLGIEVVGFILIVIAVLGRLWAGVYIYGYKNDTLITVGPYSMVRNPLYFFSFFGALGIGISSKNLIVLAIIMVFFVIYYPWVVINEEKKLEKLYPEKYAEYKKNVPRFIPKFSNFNEPKSFKVNTRKYSELFLDVMWFFWFYVLLRLLEVMHTLDIIPILFEVP